VIPSIAMLFQPIVQLRRISLLSQPGCCRPACCRAATSLLFSLTTFGLFALMGRRLTPQVLLSLLLCQLLLLADSVGCSCMQLLNQSTWRASQSLFLIGKRRSDNLKHQNRLFAGCLHLNGSFQCAAGPYQRISLGHQRVSRLKTDGRWSQPV
jgi:hypothetical protein